MPYRTLQLTLLRLSAQPIISGAIFDELLQGACLGHRPSPPGVCSGVISRLILMQTSSGLRFPRPGNVAAGVVSSCTVPATARDDGDNECCHHSQRPSQRTSPVMESISGSRGPLEGCLPPLLLRGLGLERGPQHLAARSLPQSGGAANGPEGWLTAHFPRVD